MIGNLELFIHNMGYLVGAAINICLVFFVWWVSRKKITSTVVVFILMTLSVVTFQISHAFGVMASTAEASRQIFMFNLSNIGIGIFLTHWFLALTGKEKEKKWILATIYGTGAFLIGMFLAEPYLFLLPSVPKLYFPFYYEPGPLYIAMTLWFTLIGVYYLFGLFSAYRKEIDPLQKNRLKYVSFSVIYAFCVGYTAVLLLYDIPFDPIWSMFFGLYTIPFAYAMIKYELLDIRIIAKKALLYAIIIGSIGAVISLVGISSDYIHELYPDFPRWTGWVMMSCIVGGLGGFVWNRTRDEELLKYEFINVMTHKFRTPLTRIKWALDSVSGVQDSSIKEAHSRIDLASNELVELTNTLIVLNDADANTHMYHYKVLSLSYIVRRIARSYIPAFRDKSILFTTHISSENTDVFVDENKVQFVFQIFLDNAVMYTPAGGRVNVTVSRVGETALFTLADTGIGIPKVQQKFLFNKFYRAPNARAASIDGTGIGLYMAHSIVFRNGGIMKLHSDGEGKGAVVTVEFPITHQIVDAA